MNTFFASAVFLLLAHNEIQVAVTIQIGEVGLAEIPTLKISIAKVMDEAQLC